jgi:hypothetical protein
MLIKRGVKLTLITTTKTQSSKGCNCRDMDNGSATTVIKSFSRKLL